MSEQKEPLTSHEQLQKELTMALLNDRRAQRRASYIKWGLLASVAALYVWAGSRAMSNLGGEDAKRPEEAKPHLAVVELRGAIGTGEAISFDKVQPSLKAAFADNDAKAVVLKINSPGGSPVQSALIYDEIKRLKTKYKKPVYAVGEDLVASGGYFIAMGADQFYLNRSTMAGSIGVISSGFGFSGLMDKLGVERRAFTAGESKNEMDPFSPLSPKTEGKYKELLAGVYEHFTDVVKESRGKRLKAEPASLFTGEVWTGTKVVELGLADKLGGIEDVKSEMKVDRVVTFAPRQNFWKSLASGMGEAAARTVLETASRSETIELR